MKNKGLIVALVLAVAAVGIWAAVRNNNQTTGGADEILIGGNFSITGDVATYGTSAMQGVELAIDEANAAGGVLDKKIVLKKVDNQSKQDEATNQTQKLIETDKVVAILGPVISSNTQAAGQVAQAAKVPLLSPTATAVEVTQIGDYIFRGCFLDSFQGEAMGAFAYNTVGARNVAILKLNDDYGNGLARYFKEQFTGLGGKIVAEEAFLGADVDFNAQLTKIKATNPDAIYVPGYYGEQGLIIKQARQMGITAAILGSDGMDSSELVEIAGKENLNDVFFTNHYSPSDPDPGVQAFVNAYKERYGSVPDALAALGYDSGRLMVDAIKRAGEADPQKIRQALADTEDFQGLGTTFSFDANRNPIKGAVVVELTNGEQSVRETVEVK